jgi:hypothetical protein
MSFKTTADEMDWSQSLSIRIRQVGRNLPPVRGSKMNQNRYEALKTKNPTIDRESMSALMEQDAKQAEHDRQREILAALTAHESYTEFLERTKRKDSDQAWDLWLKGCKRYEQIRKN